MLIRRCVFFFYELTHSPFFNKKIVRFDLYCILIFNENVKLPTVRICRVIQKSMIIHETAAAAADFNDIFPILILYKSFCVKSSVVEFVNLF